MTEPDTRATELEEAIMALYDRRHTFTFAGATRRARFRADVRALLETIARDANNDEKEGQKT